MFALFSAAFSSIFIAIGVAAVVGHVVLIDLLMRPTAVKVAQVPGVSQPARQ
jgi:hypothetical protein